MLQYESQAATNETNTKFPDLNIELFINLEWNTKLNVFKDFKMKKATWKNFTSFLDNKYSVKIRFCLMEKPKLKECLETSSLFEFLSGFDILLHFCFL